MLGRIYAIAFWYLWHYRFRAEQVGVYHVAKQLRKQGVPVEVAVQILA
jgi:hypothetical protein